MDKRDMFNYASIPLAVMVTVLAFLAAFLGWV